MTEVVCPGKRLGRTSEFRAGPGTYVRGTYIYASVVGPKEEQTAADTDGKPFLVVGVLVFQKNILISGMLLMPPRGLWTMALPYVSMLRRCVFSRAQQNVR